ncbi:MAG: LytTR family DNA-binding domain-containing protein [Ginsengibacter sp.]
MIQIRAIVNRLYPLEERKWAKIKLALLFGLVIFTVLFSLNPFGNNKANLFLDSTYAGILTFVSILFDYFILFPLFPRFFKEENWTIGREIILTLIIIVTITTFNILAGEFIWGVPVSVGNWFILIFYTSMLGIAPATASILINQARLLKKYRKEVISINEQFILPEPAQQVNTQPYLQEVNNEAVNHESSSIQNHLITIKAEKEKDNLTIPAAAFIAATSADNYVKVFFLENDQLKSSMLRTTLKNVEGNTADFPEFFRCHRTALINMDTVQSVSGSAQGYRLRLDHLPQEIPVSRNMNHVIKERLSSIHP